VYAEISATGSAGTLDVSINYTDAVAARQVDAIRGLDMTTNPSAFGQATFVIESNGVTALTYTTTVTSPTGSPQYALRVRVEPF
jgi:hypothetical protein